MERELNYLLADLCVKWGWCIPPNAGEAISQVKYYTAINFAKDVVDAEGLDAEYEKKWVRKIAHQFRQRFGSEEIDKATFTDRIRGQKEDWSLR